MESINYSKEQACSELKQLVNDWINAKENRNVSSLARGAGVSENCIRRVLNNNSMPITENLRKIILFIKGTDTNKNIISSLMPSLQNHFKFELSYLSFEEIGDYLNILEIEAILKDFPHQFVFERSSMDPGISVTEINEMFGSYADTIIENLSKSNLVSDTDGIIKCNQNYKNHSFSTIYYKNLSTQMIQNFYKTDSAINYLFFQNESVSKNGYAKVMDIIEDSSKKVMAAIKDNPGDIPLAVIHCMDTFSKKDFFTKKKDSE